MPKTKLLVIVGCHGNSDNPKCPHLKSERTPRSGFALDYYCRSANRMVDGYIEWDSEKRKPGDFPKFCPLKEGEDVL